MSSVVCVILLRKICNKKTRQIATFDDVIEFGIIFGVLKPFHAVETILSDVILGRKFVMMFR